MKCHSVLKFRNLWKKNKRPFTQGQNIIAGRNITFLCGKKDVPLQHDKMSQWPEILQLVKMTQFMGN